MSDLLARLVSLADCDGRAGEQLGKAMREAAAEIARLNKHIAILHDVADQRDQIILERNEQYRDAMEHAKIWRERAERAEALQNGEQTKRRAPEAKSHPDFDYCLSCGCAVMDHSLGFQEMPAGYHLMLDADGMYFFWMESETGRQSAIHWDKWAVYRGAKADAKRPR